MKQKSNRGLHDAELLLEELELTIKKDPSASAGLVVNEEDTLELLFYQSGSMKQLFRKFPEILLIDATYNVNSVGMPLYCLMIEDGFGHGRVVHYAVTTEEDCLHLKKIMQSFKEENPAWPSVGVIVVDKDFTEWKVLKEEFPEASILFCQWHVMKAMFKKMADCDVDKSERDHVRDLLRELVYSNSQDEYDDTKREVYSITNESFWKYFESNWDVCQHMWVSFKRDFNLHLGNTTNNRLESHNQKLKDLTQRSSSLTEMFRNVIRFVTTSMSEYCHNVFKEEFTTCTSADDGLTGVPDIRASCTQYAADLIVAQLKLGNSVNYQISPCDGQEYTLSGPSGSLYHVDVNSSTCSCTFKKTYCLPCRHVFALRISLNMTIFNRDIVAKRWLKTYQSEGIFDSVTPKDATPVMPEQVCVSSLGVQSSRTGTLARNQKFRKMQTLCQKLAMISSECGMPQFREKYSQVQTLIKLWEENAEVTFFVPKVIILCA